MSKKEYRKYLIKWIYDIFEENVKNTKLTESANKIIDFQQKFISQLSDDAKNEFLKLEKMNDKYNMLLENEILEFAVNFLLDFLEK